MPKKEIDDGGYVYPWETYHEDEGAPFRKMLTVCHGLTYRDWLAGLAMQGILSQRHADDAYSGPVHISELAYEQADCMIAESKTNAEKI